MMSVEIIGRGALEMASRAPRKVNAAAKFNRRQIKRPWDRSVRFHTGVEISD
jgi:hypothetical protein